MTSQSKQPLRLIQPRACEACRFARIEDVPFSQGWTQRSIECRRGDCDNWIYSDRMDWLDRLLVDLLKIN